MVPKICSFLKTKWQTETVCQYHDSLPWRCEVRPMFSTPNDTFLTEDPVYDPYSKWNSQNLDAVCSHWTNSSNWNILSALWIISDTELHLPCLEEILWAWTMLGCITCDSLPTSGCDMRALKMQTLELQRNTHLVSYSNLSLYMFCAWTVQSVQHSSIISSVKINWIYETPFLLYRQLSPKASDTSH